METKNEIWFVYLARCKDNTFYCGITNNLVKRFWQHNGIKQGGAKYTRGRRPIILLNFYQVHNKSSALKLECMIKKLPKQQKLPFLEKLQYGTKTSITNFI